MSPSVQARCTVRSATASDGPRAGRRSSPPIFCLSEKVLPPSCERRNQSAPSYSVHAAYTVPSPPTARSRLPLCHRSRVMRPLPSPATEADRLSGAEKVLPPSSERANRMSPPCEPPEKMISCHRTNTLFCASATRGSQEKVRGLRDTLTRSEEHTSELQSP